MFKAMLVIYVLNTPGTQTFVVSEMPSMAACNATVAEMKTQVDLWHKGDKPIKSYHTARCVKTNEPNNAALLEALKSRGNYPLVVPLHTPPPLEPKGFGWPQSGD